MKRSVNDDPLDGEPLELCVRSESSSADGTRERANDDELLVAKYA